LPATTAPGPESSVPKRRYRIDPQVARERARKAGRARNTPDAYIRSLETAALTAEQKRRLALLLMPFLDSDDATAGTR
jgi:hypothetical protein